MSKSKKENYQNHLEWEALQFPLILTRITSTIGLYDIPQNSVIEVWRGIDFKLHAVISGVTQNNDAFEIDSKKLENNFIPKETISGYSPDGLYIIDLIDCHVTNVTTTLISLDPIEVSFTANLSIHSLTSKFALHQEPVILYDWFLSSRLVAWFPGSTVRSLQKKYQKIRREVDSEIDSRSIESSGSSRDFALIDTPGLKCIVAIVPEGYAPEWASKVCIEYRTSFGEIPNEERRKLISEFVAFVLGCQLLKIGSTTLDNSNSLVSQYAMNYWGDNAMAKCKKRACPPVNIDMSGTNWNRLQEVFNLLIPVCLQLEEKLELSAALWKYWVACDLAVGTNLPVFSSAVEGLAAKYLKAHPEISLSYMDITAYQELIADEFQKIDAKLEGREFKNIIINKINTAVHRGANEKMELFFKSINLSIGNLEKKAMRARNIMAHASIHSADNKKREEYAKLTQVYQTLFHKVMLRILNYDEHYIDYYSQEVNRLMSSVIGGNKDS